MNDFIITVYPGSMNPSKPTKSILFHNAKDCMIEIDKYSKEGVNYTVHEANCIIDNS